MAGSFKQGWKKLKYTVLLTIIPPALSALIQIWTWTLRLRLELPKELDEDTWLKESPVILAFWHCQILVSIGALSKLCRHRKGGAVLISRSRDGEYIARTAAMFGHIAARGSSSKAGAAGLREIMRLMREGYDGVVTPDGPRGPRCRVQPGVLALGRLTQARIYPLYFELQRFWEATNWDRTQIPYPFTTCTLRVGTPMTVGRDVAPEEFTPLLMELEKRMHIDKFRRPD